MFNVAEGVDDSTSTFRAFEKPKKYIKANRNISGTVVDSYDATDLLDQHDDLDVILNCLILSTAIYFPYDEGGILNGGECGGYLTEQLDNHNFEYFVRNRFGENPFLIAKVNCKI